MMPFSWHKANKTNWKGLKTKREWKSGPGTKLQSLSKKKKKSKWLRSNLRGTSKWQSRWKTIKKWLSSLYGKTSKFTSRAPPSGVPFKSSTASWKSPSKPWKLKQKTSTSKYKSTSWTQNPVHQRCPTVNKKNSANTGLSSQAFKPSTQTRNWSSATQKYSMKRQNKARTKPDYSRTNWRFRRLKGSNKNMIWSWAMIFMKASGRGIKRSIKKIRPSTGTFCQVDLWRIRKKQPN